MERMYADLALRGWVRNTKLVTVTVAGDATGPASFTTDGDKAFQVTEISANSTSTFTFGIVSNVKSSIPIVASGTPGAAFFGANNYAPVPFPRKLSPHEVWTFTVTDTSSAGNTIDFVIHGYGEPE